ncbi:MAG: mechanosensitive ion channel family protein [Flavobacteriaceae bacterium]
MNNSISRLEAILKQWELATANQLPKLLLGLVVLVAFIFLAKLAKRISLAFYARTIKKQSDIAKIMATVIYFFFLLSGIFLALQVAGLEKFLTHILAGAGIVGIVAGFAFKDIASNLFAGLLLKIQSPFKPGDWVSIDNQYGYIIEVGWITTKIHTVPGQEVFVPNQIIYSGTFTNYSALGKRRIILKSGVSYGDDLQHVRNTALDEVKNFETYLPDEGIDFYFTDIGGSTYDFMLRFWVKFESNDDYCKGMNEAIVRIKKRFEKENISIAYPVTTLDFGVKGGVNIFDKTIKTEN